MGDRNIVRGRMLPASNDLKAPISKEDTGIYK